MIDKKYWLKKWQQHDIGFNEAEPHPCLVKYFPDFVMPIGSSVLVPLCGKSIDMQWLLQQDYQIIGIEISDIACQEFFNDFHLPYTTHQQGNFKLYRHPQIHLFCGDFFQFQANMLPGPVHAVYDRAALVAIPEEDRARYVEHCLSLMQPNSNILLVSIEYNQQQMPGPPFSVNEQEIHQLYQSCQINLVKKAVWSEIPQHLAAKGLAHAMSKIYSICY